MIILSLLLILSNFSFAVTYSVCTMGKMTGSMKDACAKLNHDVSKNCNGNILSNTKRTCCEEKIAQLSNSNVLSVKATEKYNCVINCANHLVNTLSLPDNNSQSFNYFNSPDKIPKDGIPVTFSSLLI